MGTHANATAGAYTGANDTLGTAVGDVGTKEGARVGELGATEGFAVGQLG